MGAGFQVIYTLIQQPIRTNVLGNLLVAALMGHELFARRHIDAIYVLIPQCWCSRSHINLPRTRFASHLNDLLNGRATHNGIVHEQNILALKL